MLSPSAVWLYWRLHSSANQWMPDTFPSTQPTHTQASLWLCPTSSASEFTNPLLEPCRRPSNQRRFFVIKQPKPPCPTGYHRVNECCVPNPPPCDPCNAPKELDTQGRCVCPWYLIPDGDSCRIPECPGYPLEVFVNGCYGGYCT